MKNYLLCCLFLLCFGFSPIIFLYCLEFLGYDLGNAGNGGLIILGYLTVLTLPTAFIGLLGFTAQIIYDYFQRLRK